MSTKQQKQVKTELVGRYVEEIRDCLIAGAVSGVPVYLLGAPGGGKSASLKAFGRQMYGEQGGEWCFVEFSPATQEQRVEGTIDYQKFFSENIWERVTKGTPADPEMKLIGLDELHRCNDSISDLVMGVMDEVEDRLENGRNFTQVVATGNFLPTGERFEAILDRFGIYKWLKSGEYDFKKVMKAGLLAQWSPLSLPGNLPTRKEIEDARKAVPTKRAVDAVLTFGDMFKDIVTNGLKDTKGDVVQQYQFPNNRRNKQWGRLLDKVSTLYHGTSDYDSVHQKAIDVMRYAWVLKSEQEARHWEELVKTIADPIQTAIDAVMAVAYETINKTIASSGNPADTVMNMKTEILAKLDDIAKIPGMSMEDPRYKKCNEDLFAAIGEFIRSTKSGG